MCVGGNNGIIYLYLCNNFVTLHTVYGITNLVTALLLLQSIIIYYVNLSTEYAYILMPSILIKLTGLTLAMSWTWFELNRKYI